MAHRRGAAGSAGSGPGLQRLGEDLPGFAASEIVIDVAGESALALGAGGAVALLFVAGDRVVVRALARHDLVRASVEGERLVIDTQDFAHGRVVLSLPGAAARWATRLAAT